MKSIVHMIFKPLKLAYKQWVNPGVRRHLAVVVLRYNKQKLVETVRRPWHKLKHKLMQFQSSKLRPRRLRITKSKLRPFTQLSKNRHRKWQLQQLLLRKQPKLKWLQEQNRPKPPYSKELRLKHLPKHKLRLPLLTSKLRKNLQPPRNNK